MDRSHWPVAKTNRFSSSLFDQARYNRYTEHIISMGHAWTFNKTLPFLPMRRNTTRPAGKLLDDALKLAGIDRGQAYLTNAVKHFKFILRGKKRIHNKPSIQEAIACRPWLAAELDLIKPDVLVCLGATAAQSLMGTDFRITRQRGEFRQTPWCNATIATFHPSAVLRAPDIHHREQLWSHLVADLTKAARPLFDIGIRA